MLLLLRLGSNKRLDIDDFVEALCEVFDFFCGEFFWEVVHMEDEVFADLGLD